VRWIDVTERKYQIERRKGEDGEGGALFLLQGNYGCSTIFLLFSFFPSFNLIGALLLRMPVRFFFISSKSNFVLFSL
jgi:hypothetical protein